MPCYRPLKGYRTPGGVVFAQLGRHDILGDIEVPCGVCIGCRLQRAADWATRCMHEAQMWPESCFVTLTYGEGKVPPLGSLDHRDFQLFMKRLRFQFRGRVIRFYMCGEYGPKNQRPHYHACLFNVDFRSDWEFMGKSASGADMYTSKTLENLWTHGFVTVQPLTRETAGYCARYIMKKQVGQAAQSAHEVVDPDTGELLARRSEYAAMSLRPGIGATWLDRYQSDVFPADHVVMDGQEHHVPKFYTRRLKKVTKAATGAAFQLPDAIETARQERAKLLAADQTDERRAVKEQVLKARIRNLERDL